MFLCCFSCKKEGEQKYVPNVYVDIYMYASDPGFVALNAVGGWLYANGGVKGIIVYRKSNTEFMAYDRNCTYQSSNACSKADVDSSNLIIKDACCGSEFLITDGTVLTSPATLPLKQYQTSFDGTTLHIFN